MMVEGELLRMSHRPHRSDRSRLHGTGGSQDRLPVFGMRQAGRAGGRRGFETEEWLGEFAWNLGMAFQLVEDLLDYVAQKVLGKTVGNDLREGKMTRRWSPRWAGHARRTSAGGDHPRRAQLRACAVPADPGDGGRYQGIARVKERAQAFTEKARAIIGEFPESADQWALYSVTELITERDH